MNHFLKTIGSVLLVLLGITIGPPLTFLWIALETYIRVLRLTFKGEGSSRYKTGYFDIGTVIYRPAKNKKSKTENQILGAILLVPITIILALLMLLVYFSIWKY